MKLKRKSSQRTSKQVIGQLILYYLAVQLHIKKINENLK